MGQPTTMAEAEEYSPGGDVELYISATLALLLGIMFTALGIANLFGHLLGPKGKIFIFEMDQVMGELLGIPNYSKLEAVLLLLLIGTVYMGICVSYGINARQPLPPFLVPLAYNLALLVWRGVSFLHPDYRVTVIVCGIVGLLITVLAHLLMRSRRERVKDTLVKLKKLQKFEAQMKAKNMPVVWKNGKDVPDGFKEANIDMD